MLPEPLSRTVCGLPTALSAILIMPLRFPAAVGSKVTLIVQFAPAASVGPQSSVSPKFATRRDARYVQRCCAGIGEGDRQRLAGLAHDFDAEAQARRRQSNLR